MAHGSPAAAALLILILVAACSLMVNGFGFKIPVKGFVVKVPVKGVGRKVGTKIVKEVIKDVMKNEVVQDMGRFSVEQYNVGRRHQCCNGDCSTSKVGESCKSRDLTFSKVVEAEKQVEPGKVYYYLKVEVSSPSKVTMNFDAEVVVNFWPPSRKLLSFSPSNPN